jgi:hypothetical protein
MNRDMPAGGVDDRDRWAQDDRDDRGDVRRRRRDAGGPIEGPSRFTPVRIAMAIAVVGSLVFLALAIGARDIPLLASACAVVGIVFIAVAALGGRATWRAATDARNGQALGLAVAGGLAAMIGLAAFAMAIDLALIWGR